MRARTIRATLWAALTAGAAVCIGLPVQAAPAAPAAPASRPAPPVNCPLPVLRRERWQHLPISRGGFCIDSAGAAWGLLADGNRSGMYCLETGQFALLTSGTAMPDSVTVDRGGRFWFAADGELHWFDPATGQVQRRLVGNEGVRGTARAGSRFACFQGALEHSSGRLYFADTTGVDLHDKGAWAYTLMIDFSFRPDTYRRAVSGGVCMIEGPDRQVLLWTPRGHFGGLWVHEGKSWTRVSKALDPRLEDIQALVPLRGDWVLIGRNNQPAFLLDLGPIWPLPGTQEMLAAMMRLGDPGESVRAEAERAVLAMGPRARAKLADAAGLIADERIKARALAVIGRVPAPPAIRPPAAPQPPLHNMTFLCHTPGGDTLIAHGLGEQALAAVRPDGRVVRAGPNVPGAWFYPTATLAHNHAIWAVPLNDGHVMIRTDPPTVWDGEAFRVILNEPFTPGDRWTPVGQDNQGRIYFQYYRGADSGEVLVFDARYEDRRPHLPYTCFPAAGGEIMQFATLDSKGRLWARLDPRRRPFLSRYERGKWTHLDDPGPPLILYEAAGDDGPQRIVWRLFKDGKWQHLEAPEPRPAKIQDVPVDSDILYHSRRWDRRSGMTPFNQGVRFREDPDKRLPALANPILLQPLKDGGLVAVDESNRAYFFDGKEWFVHACLPELVWAHRGRLVEMIDNSLSPGLGVDATGRIWASRGPSWNHEHWGFAAGPNEWTRVSPGIRRFTRDSRRCLSFAGLLDTTVFPPATKEALAPGTGSSEIQHAVFDARGRIWLMDGNEPSRIEGDCVVRLPEDLARRARVPALADSSGRVWFLSSCVSPLEITVLCPGGNWLTAGTATRRPYIAPHFYGRIHEQSKDTFWLVRSRQLTRLRVTGEPGREKLAVDREYAAGVPEEIRWSGIDAEGALWVLSAGREGLVRYELPKELP